MFDLQRYNTLREAVTICEHRLPWVHDFPRERSLGRTKLLAVITYLCTQMHQMEDDYRAQLS
jgi:hypothetical protein